MKYFQPQYGQNFEVSSFYTWTITLKSGLKFPPISSKLTLVNSPLTSKLGIVIFQSGKYGFKWIKNSFLQKVNA